MSSSFLRHYDETKTLSWAIHLISPTWSDGIHEIDAFEQRRLVLQEKAIESVAPQPSFKETLELSLQFLANPYKIWLSGDYFLRRMVIRLVFPEPLNYCKNEGYRTPAFALPFKALTRNSNEFLADLKNGAVEKTRTSTGQSPQRPQRCASTNSATTAFS